MSILVETFPAVAEAGFCRNAFIGRVAGLDVTTDRELALERLAAYHRQALRDLEFSAMAFITAEQVHGNAVAIVGETSQTPVPGVDALITNRPNVCLGIYVADCCAVYVQDSISGCIGLAHAGKKGTELGIVPAMLRKMEAAFGLEPANAVVQLSPCIRPPFYEVDFAAEIIRQSRQMGVGKIIDPGTCTAAEPQRYYSYRMEKGKTGRMLAAFALLDRARTTMED